MAADEGGLEAERLDGVFQLVDGLLRRAHGHDGDRREPARMLAESLGVELVERPRYRAAHLFVAQADEAEAERGVHHGEVDAELVQAAAHEARQHRRRAIERIRCRHMPERGPAQALAPALCVIRAVPLVHRDGFEDLGKSRGNARARNVLQHVLEGELAFDDMRIGVDHGVAELLAYGVHAGTLGAGPAPVK